MSRLRTPAEPAALTRRTALRATAHLALVPILAGAMPQLASRGGHRRATTLPPVPEGHPGEFNFLAGEWRIAHRMRKAPDSDTWIEFAGEATCWTIQNGAGSVEDLRVPARNFRGMGLRLLDLGAKVWSDFWVNAASGVLTTPGTTGGFAGGAGTFISEDDDNGTITWNRGIWDQVTPRSHRWLQSVSHDRGQTWTDTWIMHWTRVGRAPVVR